MESRRPQSIVIALGSNLGERRVYLRRAVELLSSRVRLVRLSGVWETDPIECPPGSRPFLNMVVSGWTCDPARRVLSELLAIESLLGRRRRLPNDPRVIDLDLILYGAHQIREDGLLVPHPRFTARNFVLAPLREIGLDWVVPGNRVRLRSWNGAGRVVRLGDLY